MKLILKESLFLILSFATVYIWQQTILSHYTIQLLGVLIIGYLILAARKKFQFFDKHDLWSIYLLTTIVILLVFATGVMQSTLFFLLYFLCFGIAFVFEPIMVFVFVALTWVLFLPIALSDDVTGNMLRLGSLILIAPLAFFLGREFKKGEQEKK